MTPRSILMLSQNGQATRPRLACSSKPEELANQLSKPWPLSQMRA